MVDFAVQEASCGNPRGPSLNILKVPYAGTNPLSTLFGGPFLLLAAFKPKSREFLFMSIPLLYFLTFKLYLNPLNVVVS